MNVNYNERSWAIDLISEINHDVRLNPRAIRRAGGEFGVHIIDRSYFPDVLLFNDSSSGGILQGWELKMPDTAITDSALISNAEMKAVRLGLNSFVVWNVNQAVLYIKHDNDGPYSPYREWALARPLTRQEVMGARAEWTDLLRTILRDLNEYFENNILHTTTVVDTFDRHEFLDTLISFVEHVSSRLRNAASASATFDAEVRLWWREIRHEHPNEREGWHVLARTILLSWYHKFVFAHVLKVHDSRANLINEITMGTTQEQAAVIFSEISKQCDYWNVFRPMVGETLLPPEVWLQLLQFNSFFIQIGFQNIDPGLLHRVLKNTVAAAKRKFAGQYATPAALAELLLRLLLNNKREAIYDPCCGTGTIPRVAYQIKKEYHIPPHEAISTIWASDKFSFPLQVATLALSEPETHGSILNVFQADASRLHPGMDVTLRDPYDGDEVTKTLPLFPHIASNLPFVQFEDVEELNASVLQRFGETSNFKLTKKSDLYAYLTIYLWDLLQDNGRLGIIVSNSWLGTDWGKLFRKTLEAHFHIEAVVISGKGRWFSEADVVTTIVILKKKAALSSPLPTEQTKYITLREDLNNTNLNISDLASNILVNAPSQQYACQIISQSDMYLFSEFGLNPNAWFTNLSWIQQLPSDTLIRANNLFTFLRGERRGWNPLFYPERPHGIEDEYIRPVLRTPRSITRLIAQPDAEAFCCGEDTTTLANIGHHGALSWIQRFQSGRNNTGVPLPQALARSKLHWYEMSDSTMAEFMFAMNYDKRLFVAKGHTAMFIDQRLIGLRSVNPDDDLDLYHALFNSLIGLFYIEALGFGRGLGALDLNAGKLESQLHILNPAKLSPTQIADIKSAFAPLVSRPIHNITDELEDAQRESFDNSILEAFGILHLKDAIKGSLLDLYAIRQAVRQ